MEIISGIRGVAQTFQMPFVTFGVSDFLSGVILATGDVTISKDNGAFTNIDTLPTILGKWMVITLSATEKEADTIAIEVVDQTSTKVFQDTGAIVSTGITDILSSLQDQLSGLANVGSAINRPAASYTLTTGTQSANTYTATEALDGTNHEHTDDAGVLDLYYEFNIGAGFASSVQVTGYVNGNNDDVDVYGYDWVAAAWVQIGNIDGTAQSSNQVKSFDMFVNMVGNGANQGVVRVRFYKASGLTSATLAVDQIFVAFNQTAEGYQNSAVWFNSNASNTNTVKGIDGTATNAVSTMAAVNTLLALTNLSRVEVISGSTVTLAASQNNQVFSGENWTLDVNGQDYSGSSFIGAHASGIASGVGTEQTFKNCHLGAMTHIKETHFVECGVSGTQTAGEAGDYYFDRPHSAIAGTATWVWDFGAAVGNTNLNWRNGSGGIQFENMGDTGTDTASIEGRGQIIEGACTGGIVAVRGNFETSGITNLTLIDGARYESGTLVNLIFNELITSGNYNIKNSFGKIVRELKEIAGYEGGFIYYDSVGGTAGDEKFINGILETPVDNETDLLALKVSLNFHQIKITAGSLLTLAASHDKQSYEGEAWTLVLGGQSISASFFHGAAVSGICTGVIKPKFEDCEIDGVTSPPAHFDKCGFNGDFVVGSAGNFFFADGCHSSVAGITTPSFDYGAAIGVTNLNFRGYHGGMTIKNMKTGDNLSFDGDGQIIIDATCTGGTIRTAGHQIVTGATAFIAAGGIISDDARFAVDQLKAVNIIAPGGGYFKNIYWFDGGIMTIKESEDIDIPFAFAGNPTGNELWFVVTADIKDGPIEMTKQLIEGTDWEVVDVDGTDTVQGSIPFIYADTNSLHGDYESAVIVKTSATASYTAWQTTLKVTRPVAKVEQLV